MGDGRWEADEEGGQWRMDNGRRMRGGGRWGANDEGWTMRGGQEGAN